MLLIMNKREGNRFEQINSPLATVSGKCCHLFTNAGTTTADTILVWIIDHIIRLVRLVMVSANSDDPG
jgi:hypothetical protein